MSPGQVLKKSMSASVSFLGAAAPIITLVMSCVIATLAFFIQSQVTEFAALQKDVHELQMFRERTEGNRYTAIDALRDQATAEERRQILQAQIAAINKFLPDSFPPPETREKLDRLLSLSTAMQRVVTENQISIGRLESHLKSQDKQ